MSAGLNTIRASDMQFIVSWLSIWDRTNHPSLLLQSAFEAANLEEETMIHTEIPSKMHLSNGTAGVDANIREAC